MGIVRESIVQSFVEALGREFNGHITTENIEPLGLDPLHVFGADSIGSDLMQSDSVTDDELASPLGSAYLTLLRFNTVLVAKGNNLYFPSEVGNDAIQSGAAGNTAGWPSIYFDDADRLVTSKTQKLRIRMQAYVNGTAPTVNFTVSLYSFTITGAANTIIPNAASQVASSTVAINTPGTNSVNHAVSSAFDIPADGHYAMVILPSGSMAANSSVAIAAQLQTNHV